MITTQFLNSDFLILHYYSLLKYKDLLKWYKQSFASLNYVPCYTGVLIGLLEEYYQGSKIVIGVCQQNKII